MAPRPLGGEALDVRVDRAVPGHGEPAIAERMGVTRPGGQARLRRSAAACQAHRALDADAFCRKAFGGIFIGYLLTMKRAEVARYQAAVGTPADTASDGEEGPDVSDWEMREYFGFF